jgi:hypothetical protein
MQQKERYRSRDMQRDLGAQRCEALSESTVAPSGRCSIAITAS